MKYWVTRITPMARKKWLSLLKLRYREDVVDGHAREQYKGRGNADKGKCSAQKNQGGNHRLRNPFFDQVFFYTGDPGEELDGVRFQSPDKEVEENDGDRFKEDDTGTGKGEHAPCGHCDVQG